MSDNDRSPQNSDKPSGFGKFMALLIALVTAIGGGTGIAALLERCEADPPPIVSPSTPIPTTPVPTITQPQNPDRTTPAPPTIVNDGSSASEFCSSQFSNPRDYQDCLQAAGNCDSSSVIYESCILGEMGSSIIQNP
jgi:hypothetical protein